MLQQEERRKSIARLINIDAIDKVRIEIRLDKNKKEARGEGIKTGIKDQKELKNRKKEIIDELKQKSNLEKEQEEKYKTLRTTLSKSKKIFEELNKLRDKHQALQSKVDKSEDRLSDFLKLGEKLGEQINQIKSDQVNLKTLKKQLSA